MCKKVSCPQCGKASWAGCGAHVEEVLADTPLSERCKCDAEMLEAIKSHNCHGQRPCLEFQGAFQQAFASGRPCWDTTVSTSGNERTTARMRFT